MSEQEIYATLVEIKEEPTALYKILKFENLVSGGGEAKLAITEGYVFLNGQVETQKRKKIYAGDIISFNDQHYQIALKGQTEGYEVVKQKPAAKPEKSKAVKKMRKPISF
ncbi:MAG: ribosome-associated protein [Psychromonas sp.]|jgi:ribosome-associated protein|uniref:RNA-binding S4 domain-containing protein n=1 Tax=Psychromonas sp. TaxID=1884585 RepID=UPI0039E465B9